MILNNETPRRRAAGYQLEIIFLSPQAAGNITQEIPRLSSGSVRLNNFASQN